MSEFDIRARNYRQAKLDRERARTERDPRTKAQLLARAAACERRARGYGSGKGKNRRGA